MMVMAMMNMNVMGSHPLNHLVSVISALIIRLQQGFIILFIDQSILYVSSIKEKTILIHLRKKYIKKQSYVFVEYNIYGCI